MCELISKKEYIDAARVGIDAVMELGTAQREAYDACADWSFNFQEFPGCEELRLNPDVPADKNLANAIVFAIQDRQPELAIMFLYGIVTPRQLSAVRHLATAKKIELEMGNKIIY